MKCYNHGNIDAVGTCISCGKAVCKDCGVEVNGKLVCKPCLSTNSIQNITQKESKKSFKPRHFVFLAIGGLFALMIPVNLLLSLLFPPIFLQFLFCMIPMALFAFIFIGAGLFKV